MNSVLRILAMPLLLMALPAIAQDGEPLRDPTRPLSYSVARSTAPELVLQAVLQRQSGREAIVNGQRVRAGSAIDGARIEEINPQSVVYSYQGQRQTLNLRPHVRQ